MSFELIDISEHYSEHPQRCHCPAHTEARQIQMLDDIERWNKGRTCEQIIADLAVFTDEQKARAWSPEPPREPTGGSDCRIGGSCGLDFNRETRHAKWRQAQFRLRKEERAAMKRLPPEPLKLMADPTGIKTYRNVLLALVFDGVLAAAAYGIYRLIV